MIRQLFEGLRPGTVIVFLLLLAAATTITYSNHFYNDFHFDDAHTITNNVYIRDIRNIPLFFKDGTTFSSLPQNQSYRPVVSTSLAIDYWLGKGYDPFFFHLSSFVIFLLQGFLLFFLIFKIFHLSFRSEWNFYLAAFATAWYQLHPANAETINYIIARSDLQSTFFVVVAFVMYIFSPLCRRFHLYLVPVALGALAKPPAVMFAPMLFFYELLFEEKVSLTAIFKSANSKQFLNAIKKTAPSFIFCAIMYVLVDRLTPKTWEAGGRSVFHYAITQPFVILHYFRTFFLPSDLSADTDWTPLSSIADYRFFAGCAFIIALLVIAARTSANERLRPISFGILWFFLALIPSSSVIPLSEVMNDHRIFFPYIGLVIAVCWSIGVVLTRYKVSFVNKTTRNTGFAAAAILLCAYAYGTRERNKVWHSEDSLWEDVTIKSPHNGRGLMNYGLTRMAKGDYGTAEKYFERALVEFPRYHYLHINMAILKNATGKPAEAETYFKQALQYGVNNANSYYYYGKFLEDHSRHQEAIAMLTHAMELAPSDLNTRSTLMRAYQESGEWDKLRELAESTLALDPQNASARSFLESARIKKGSLELLEDQIRTAPSAEKYLDLSLKYYQSGRYEKCIDAATEAVKLKPDYFEAYNNIGSAYNALKQFDKAIPPLAKAVEINPGFQLAKNNLAYAEKQSNELREAEALVRSKPTAANYLALGLRYYNNGEFEKSISAYESAIKINPDYAEAYNNMGASYNSIREWDKAIEACEKALKINPEFKLAAGNLNWAKEQKAKSIK